MDPIINYETLAIIFIKILDRNRWNTAPVIYEIDDVVAVLFSTEIQFYVIKSPAELNEIKSFYLDPRNKNAVLDGTIGSLEFLGDELYFYYQLSLFGVEDEEDEEVVFDNDATIFLNSLGLDDAFWVKLAIEMHSS